MSDAPISGFPAAAAFLLTQEFAANESGASRKVTGQQVSAAWSMDFLGSSILSAGANSTPDLTLTYPPGSGIAATRDLLIVLVRVASYGGSPDATGDIASLRFNGDSGANYWSRHLHYTLGAWIDEPLPSQTLIRLAETNSRLSRNVYVQINNLATRGKTCNIKNQTGTADAAVVGSVNVAGGEWVNLVDQITSIQLINQGANNMGAGTGFMVFGKNF